CRNVPTPSWPDDGLRFDRAVDGLRAIVHARLANVLLDRLLGGAEHAPLEHGNGHRGSEIEVITTRAERVSVATPVVREPSLETAERVVAEPYELPVVQHEIEEPHGAVVHQAVAAVRKTPGDRGVVDRTVRADLV